MSLGPIGSLGSSIAVTAIVKSQLSLGQVALRKPTHVIFRFLAFQSTIFSTIESWQSAAFSSPSCQLSRWASGHSKRCKRSHST
jgi:hypothetical protein